MWDSNSWPLDYQPTALTTRLPGLLLMDVLTTVFNQPYNDCFVQFVMGSYTNFNQCAAWMELKNSFAWLTGIKKQFFYHIDFSDSGHFFGNFFKISLIEK